MIKIEQKILEELLDKEAKLNALENGGVDNWEFYNEAIRDYENYKIKQEKEVELINNLLSDLSQMVSMPSEPQAGYGFEDIDASQVVKDFIKKIRDLDN